jgi:hypothetical protein
VNEEPQKAGRRRKDQRSDKSGEFPDLVPVEASKQQGVNVRRRRREATETLAEFRHNEIMRVHNSLARICGVNSKWWKPWSWMEWDKIFGALAILFWGGFIAAALAMIPFLDADPSKVAKREYKWLLAITGAFALIFTLVRLVVRSKEIESVATVYEYVDEIVASYEDEESD